MKHVEYIIVGQGLAGSTLAQYLIRENRSFMVFGSPVHKKASEVAAGLFNPITGKKMVLTWNAGVLFPLLHVFYKEAEAMFGTSFLYPKTIYRPFADMQSQNDFWAKSEQHIAGFAHANADHRSYEPYVWNEYGGLSTSSSGYVDVKKYVRAIQELLSTQQIYKEEAFEYEHLEIKQECVCYKGITAEKIIFAEGYYNALNPYFNWLPVNGMKGDVLTLQIEDYPLKDVVNKNYFIIPLENGTFRMGSSYIRSFQDDAPTENGLKEITEGASKILKRSFQVIDQQAGIRPVVPDHRPIAGQHPEYTRLFILNGLGTKGVSLAPYAAKAVSDLLIHGQEIDESISVNRFNYLYFKQKIIL